MMVEVKGLILSTLVDQYVSSPKEITENGHAL